MKVGELSVLKGCENIKYNVNKLHTVIGHHENCEIRLYGKNIADKHCIITNRKGSKPTVRNLSELGSTIVNGNDIKMEDHTLEDHAVISIGPYKIIWSSVANSQTNSRERYMSTRSWASPNRLVSVVSPLNRHSIQFPIQRKKRLREVQNIQSLCDSFKSSEDEFDSPISFPSSVKTRGSSNKFFTHSTPARFNTPATKNYSKSTIYSPTNDGLILSPSLRSSSYRTVTDINNLTQSPLISSLKSPSNTMDNLFKSDVSSSKKKVSFQKKSTALFPSFSKSPFKRRKSISKSSECVDKTPNSIYEYKNLKPEPKLDKNKKAALIACHKKKTPQKEEPSESQSFLVIGKKSHRTTLKRELVNLSIDMNISQRLTSCRLSRSPSSSPQVKTKKRTITPVKDDSTLRGSTRISASETPLAFTQESTNNKDELLKALNLSRKSDIVEKQRPFRRLRSFNKTDSDGPEVKKKNSKASVQNKNDEGVKALFNDSETFYTNGLKNLFYPSPNSVPVLKNSHRNRSYMNRVFTTSPLVDYTDVSGVKKLFTVSPKGDYKNPLGIKELFAREETYYMNSNNVRELFSDVPGPSGILSNSLNRSNQDSKTKIDKIFKKVQFEDDQLQRTKIIDDFSQDISTSSRTRPSKSSQSDNSSETENAVKSTGKRRSAAPKTVEIKEIKVLKSPETKKINPKATSTISEKLLVFESSSEISKNGRKSITPPARRTRNAAPKKKISVVKTVLKVIIKSPKLKRVVKGKQNKTCEPTQANTSNMETPKKTVKNNKNVSESSAKSKSKRKSEKTTPVGRRTRNAAPKKKISVAKTVLKIETKSPAKPKKVVKGKQNSKTSKPTQKANTSSMETPQKTLINNKNVSESSAKTKNSTKSKETTPVGRRTRNAAPKKKISVAKTVLKIETKSPAKPKKVIKGKQNSKTSKPTQKANTSSMESPQKTLKNNKNVSESSAKTKNSTKSKETTPVGRRTRNAAPKKKISVAKTVLKIETKSPAKPKKVIKGKQNSKTSKTQQATKSSMESPKKTAKNNKNESASSTKAKNNIKSKVITPVGGQTRNAAPKKEISVAKTVLKVKITSPAKPKKVIKSKQTSEPKTTTQVNTSSKSNMETPKKTVKGKKNESTSGTKSKTAPKKKTSVAKTDSKTKTKSPAKPKKVDKGKNTTPESKTRTKKTDKSNELIVQSKKTVQRKSTSSTKTEKSTKSKKATVAPKKKITLGKTVLKIENNSPAKPKKVVNKKTDKSTSLKTTAKKTVSKNAQDKTSKLKSPKKNKTAKKENKSPAKAKSKTNQAKTVQKKSKP